MLAFMNLQVSDMTDKAVHKEELRKGFGQQQQQLDKVAERGEGGGKWGDDCVPTSWYPSPHFQPRRPHEGERQTRPSPPRRSPGPPPSQILPASPQGRGHPRGPPAEARRPRGRGGHAAAGRRGAGSEARCPHGAPFWGVGRSASLLGRGGGVAEGVPLLRMRGVSISPRPGAARPAAASRGAESGSAGDVGPEEEIPLPVLQEAAQEASRHSALARAARPRVQHRADSWPGAFACAANRRSENPIHAARIHPTRGPGSGNSGSRPPSNQESAWVETPISRFLHRRLVERGWPRAVDVSYLLRALIHTQSRTPAQGVEQMTDVAWC